MISDLTNKQPADPIERIAQSVPVVRELDPTLLAALKAEIKAEIANELKTDKQREMLLERQRREATEREYREYVAKMKVSEDPWVDVQGWVESDHGVQIKLDWNDAFVDYLRAEGVTGADDDSVVQKYITLLLRDMSDRIENRDGKEEGDFDG